MTTYHLNPSTGFRHFSIKMPRKLDAITPVHFRRKYNPHDKRTAEENERAREELSAYTTGKATPTQRHAL